MAARSTSTPGADESALNLRLFITGASGAGKSTLATQLGDRLRLPVHQLDPIAFTDRRWTIRPLEQKVSAVAAILEEPGWIAEGGHVGWTEPLLEAADLIIWLDISVWTTLRRRTQGLGPLLLIRELPQVLWQVRWYLRPFRKHQDLDRWPSRAAIRHFLRNRMTKVRVYRTNPGADEILAQIDRA